MPPAASLFRAVPASGKGIALLLSASVHAAVALAAVRGAPHRASNADRPQDAVAAVAELDLTLADPPEPRVAAPHPAPVAPHARHHHGYPVPPDHDASAHDPSLRHTLPLTSPTNWLPAVAPVVVDTPAPTTAHFVMTVGASTRAPIGTGGEHGTSEPQSSSYSQTEPVAEALVDTPAKALTGATPRYTPEAEAAGIEGDVPLEIVVDSAGSVIAARVLAHLGYGLDEAALRSVRGFRFSPARRAGNALPVRMRWLMRFQLR